MSMAAPRKLHLPHGNKSYIFELSGEHETLPRAEALAVLQTQNAIHEIEGEDRGILVVRAERMDISQLQRRLALTHGIALKYLVLPVDTLSDNKRELKIGEGTFAVRAKRIQSQHGELDLKALEKQVADLVEKGNSVDLENPDIELRVIVTDRIYVGKSLVKMDRNAFETRKVQHRPYFSPISLHPRLARALVNLSRVRDGQTLLDPFCGTGGVLMEAALVGARPVGSDIDTRMVAGSKENLAALGIEGVPLFHADISDIKGNIEKVDAIATDPPYGKAATTKREEPTSLYKRAFETFTDILKDGGYAAVALPDAESVSLGGEYLVLKESHAMKVHRSLTRHFCVFRKE
jgi:tRNA (guanine10-N2)-dimethyltransferase